MHARPGPSDQQLNPWAQNGISRRHQVYAHACSDLACFCVRSTLLIWHKSHKPSSAQTMSKSKKGKEKENALTRRADSCECSTCALVLRATSAKLFAWPAYYEHVAIMAHDKRKTLKKKTNIDKARKESNGSAGDGHQQNGKFAFGCFLAAFWAL